MDHGIGSIGAEKEISSAQSSLGEHAAHSLDVSEEVAGLAVPVLNADRVDVVGGLSCVVPDFLRITHGLGIDVLLHGAAVVDDGLSTHPLLTACDASVKEGHVLDLDTCGSLSLVHIGEKRLSETALLQIVDSEDTGGSDAGRRILGDLVAGAVYRDVTDSGSHERDHPAVTVLVLDKDLVCAEQVAGRSREVPVTEKARLRHHLTDSRDKVIGAEKI